MPSYFLHSCSVLCLLTLMPTAHAEDRLQSRAEVGVKAGSERSVLTTEFWAPLAQKNDRVIYTDLRLMGDDDSNREGNLGFGYRQIYAPTNSVLGAHAWIDRRRTEHGNNFHEITLGVESLGSVIDLRANGYIALDGAKTAITPNMGPTTPYLAGTGLFYNTNGSITETPQHGVDAEAGYRLPVLEKHIDTLRVFGGGYHFFKSGTDNVTGIRIRTEAQINSALSVGARFQHDGPRGSQGFLEATLKFPFSAKKMFQKSGLRARLDESPERDIDIVTGAKIDNGQRQIVNQTSGEAQRILYVDNSNTNAGDGTKENPFNNLAYAQTALQANDILYIAAGNGTTSGMNQGITISQNNVQLIGSGSALTIQGITFLNAGAAPKITNTQIFVDDGVTVSTNYYGMGSLTGNGVMVTADNALITGLTIQNVTGSGVYLSAGTGQAINNITVQNNTIHDTTNGSGVYVRTLNGGTVGNITVQNNTMIDNGAGAGTGNNRGVFAVAISNSSSFGNVTIANNTINSSRNANAIEVKAAGGSINNVTVSGNNTAGSNYANITINTEITNAIAPANHFGGFIDNVTINNNISQLSNNFGIALFQSNAGSKINTATLTNNISSSNANYGFYVSNSTNSLMNSVTLNNNVSNNNRGSGTNITASNGASIEQVTIQNHTSNGNINNGITIFPTGNGSRIGNLVVNNVNTSGNTGIGVNINPINGATLNTASLTAVNASGNGTHGFNIDVNTNATLGSLALASVNALNNATNGVNVILNSGGTIGNLTLVNSIMNGNTQRGVYLNAISTAILSNVTLSNNTANNNGLYGINASINSASRVGTITISGNTTNNNQSAASAGIVLAANGANTQITTATISGNTANNNVGTGILSFISLAGRIDNLSVNSNTTSGNAVGGIQVYSTDAGSLMSTVAIANNTTNNNVSYGVLLKSQTNGIITTANVTNNTANGNTGATGYGIRIAAFTTLSAITNSTVSGNTTNNNAQAGLYLYADTTSSLSSSVFNNNSTGNATNGVYVNKATSGTFVVDMGGGSLGSIGGNRVFNNTGTEVQVQGNYALSARTNYWGGTDLTGGEKTLGGTSTVDSTGFLTVDPRP